MRQNNPEPDPIIGLRERKKSKLKAQLKQVALKLFVEQGYEAVTIEQIAERVEVSPRTFFRYFASKEDLIFDDDYDARLIASFRSQPPKLTVVQALRRALRAVFSQLTEEEQLYEQQRHAIILSAPELQVRNGHELIRNIELLTNLIAERTQRQPEDQAVRTLAGALVGVLIAAYMAAQKDPRINVLDEMDASFAQLESMMGSN